ncbi:thioredoxin-like protein [Ostreococcus tauri]|uniref:Thioredoxin-like protein n=1 Tax=Ostreococcus tauri TaxID=70448 RepID=A0A1Y5IK35_OSTTA|nr:thioredoxin-like protein [Ostreococcus tauri]
MDAAATGARSMGARAVCARVGARDARAIVGNGRRAVTTRRTRGGDDRRAGAVTRARSAERKGLEAIADAATFDAVTGTERMVVVDFMATWCRKCVFLRGKLEKAAATRTDVKMFTVDVNAVSQELVRGCGVTQMPTLQIWRDGEKIWEIVAGEDGDSVIQKLFDEIQRVQDAQAKT